ncbi:MAG: hypothetical protein ABIP51_09845 [Bacteroidia bacterium]
MENGEINEYTVSATFTRKYLSDRGYSYEYFEALSKHPIVKTEHLVAEWRFADVLEIHSLKEIFNVVNLNFHEFIEAYCEHLKSL